MQFHHPFVRLVEICVVVCASSLSTAQQVNIPIGERGELPLAEDGRKLNLDFEAGTLADWTAAGKAFAQQPIRGEIDPRRPFGADKKSEHTGEYWIGGYEKLQDTPTGTLTSVPFKVTHPFASFLIGGGSHNSTRVELVRVADGKVFFQASGRNAENLRPVIVPLRAQLDQMIFIRIVDEQAGGWGHVNFDDFRFHRARPVFSVPPAPPAPPQLAQLYPNAGMTAAAAAKAMQVPPGFRVQAAAAEPDIRQPIALALDDRGRVWIAEAFTYPQRAPDGEGRDRILVCEDTDQDGTLDNFKVFAEGLNLVSGLEVGFGGVWVGAAPYLLFIPDRNRDDVPDAAPQVLLDGWGYEDTHETLNAFIWGPDGWLYGCHGVFTHSRVGQPGTPPDQRVRINAGIWRYHPVRHEFEVFAEGTSNPWGVDFDDHGQAFCTACVIPHLYHVVQGARYQRQAGEHFNQYTYDDIKTIADHRHYTGNQWNNDDRRASDNLGGGHAHAGAMIYLGGAWPNRYHNQLFMSNIHGNRVNVDHLEDRGSGFVGSHGPDFLLTGDQWSQMLNLRYGPDGQVWVIDWYDANQCHRREEEVHDRSNGRIYRVTFEDAAAVSVDLHTATDAELVELQLNSNDWYVRHARRILQERAAAGKLDGAVPGRLAQLALQHDDTTRRLRALWALHAAGGNLLPLVEKLLADPDPYVRGWTIQLLLEKTPSALAEELLATLIELAERDTSPVVRLYLASAAGRIPVALRWELLAALTRHAEDAQDHNLPLMYWYAMEPLAEVDSRRALALALAAGEQIPILPKYMIRRIGSSSDEHALGLLVQGLREVKEQAEQLVFLRGMNEALRAKRQADTPDGWAALYPELAQSENSEVRVQAAALALTFGDPAAAEPLQAVLHDPRAALPQRRSALAFLLKARDPKLAQVLHSLLAHAQLRGDALRGLAALDDPETPVAILDKYAQFTPAERRDALATLTARPAYALALLDAVDKQRVPPGHLTADVIRQLRSLQNAQVMERIGQVWGTVRETAADQAAMIARYAQLIAAERRNPPDVNLGRAVFAKTCAQCHTLFGSGGNVGPDLTGSNRADVNYLLSNVLDPSAVMAKEYQPTIMQTEDGRVITGIVRQGDAQSLIVQTANESVVVPRGEIAQMKLSETSMMPNDLLRPLSEHEVRSLVRYVSGPGQVPSLATVDNLAGFFNGQDLAGWVGDAQLWSVENGEVVGRTGGLNHNEFLVSELAVEDFRLTLEAKLVDNRGNSGIQFRSQPLAGGEVRGYQADIGAGWWGKLYEELGRGLLWDVSGEGHVKPGEWNTYEIVAVGSRLQTWINGQRCVDLDDPQGARRGVIALQLHSGEATEVRFRNFKLQLLSGTAPATGFPASAGGPAGTLISFRKHQLDHLFRSEAVATGDFNHDGLVDIAAGSVWYEAPDWKMHAIRQKPESFEPGSYSDSFCNFADDLDGDGHLDLIVVDFPGKPTWWFQNPGASQTPWTRHQCAEATHNESPAYADLDGDWLPELLLGIPGKRMGFAQPTSYPYAPWKFRAISDEDAPGADPFSHGLGIGDVNRDGRSDVLVTQGWWEAPVEPGQPVWQFHEANFGPAASHIHVYDFDGDGDSDVLTSSAHGYGIYWHEQTGEGWTTHEIDRSFSQTHALRLADIDGDGLPDFVTGKRYWAHNGHDPGGNEPAVICWFQLARENGKPVWTRHQFDHDSGVGTQFEVTDVDGDGLLDVVTSNKKGVFYFQQQRK